MPRKIAAGNWKMNGSLASTAMVEALAKAFPAPECEVIVCPPFPLIPALVNLNSPFTIGAQDCHFSESGAHTGDVSPQLLKEIGCGAVILGHSERRADHGETSALVARKVTATQNAGLTAIVCVGETEADRDGGRTLKVVEGQLAGSLPDGTDPDALVIAYEPVWAIGTGRTPVNDEIAEVHAAIRDTLEARFGGQGKEIRILYGGSVKPGNASEIFAIANVDGGLVGGASLTAEDFGPIVAAAES
ncbi:triose-phosphate isomerase [Algicella marina]|uniref:Triosephosphate isomerase n=1 Tax=Algicella marina TaxID=2683284 RepID=A0A6P1T0X8_9RHOB|nr:triose-phosphate isomerase [Algicella marina]QHQ34939.1 triose-phosphate isomerase [Algicella marina]